MGAFGLAGTLGSATAGAQGSPVKVGFAGSVTWLGQVPIMVAADKGFFKDEGIDLDYLTVLSSADRILAVSSGSAAFSNLGRGTVLAQLARGNNSFYWFGNIDQAPGNEGCYARSGINTIADLKGKKIAANTSSEFTMDQLLKDNKIDRKDINFFDLPPNEMVQALGKGDVDAVCVWQPFLGAADKASPGGKLLGTDKDTESFKRTGTVASADILIISREIVDKQPELAKKIARAIFRGVDFTNKNPDETAKIVAHYFRQSPEEIREGMKTFEYPDLSSFEKHVAGQVPQMREYAEWLVERRKISTLPDIDKAKNTSFIPTP
jgi:NitT/TauT family transport system substrate-binding protein